MKKLLPLAATLLLAACATPQPPDPRLEAAAREPLVCRSPEQCKRFWQRAQVWVVNNSHWKIQTATDSLIQTYSGTRNDTDRAFVITREPYDTNGAERISIRSGCGNFLGCRTGELETAAHFKASVRAGEQ